MTDANAPEQPKPFAAVWEDPPATSRRGRKSYDDALAAFVETLQLNPGRTARLAPAEGETDHPASRAVKLRKDYPDLVVRTAASIAGKGRCHIWASWEPPADAPGAEGE